MIEQLDPYLCLVEASELWIVPVKLDYLSFDEKVQHVIDLQ